MTIPIQQHTSPPITTPHRDDVAHAILPPPPPRRHPTPCPHPATHWPPPFPLPKSTQRAIILSNCPGFHPELFIQPGDTIYHLNTARHATRTIMSIPGTQHILLVRHDTQSGTTQSWFTPRSFIGFSYATFIHDSYLLPHFRWFSQFRHQGYRASPTTGFIAANSLRELYPNTPLILLGFDPAHPHGTTRWHGHNWNAEAAWYSQNNFLAIPPLPLLHILICSCLPHTEARQACRSTWLANLPPSISYQFFIGGPTPPPPNEQHDTLWLPQCRDTYDALPHKTLAALSHAASHHPTLWLAKCDDDSYLHLPRLSHLLSNATTSTSEPPRCIARISFPNRPLGGGAGYFIHHSCLPSLLPTAHSLLPHHWAEDHLIHASLLSLHIPITNSTLLCQFLHQGSPSPTNSIISSHHLSPTSMLHLHSTLTTP